MAISAVWSRLWSWASCRAAWFSICSLLICVVRPAMFASFAVVSAARAWLSWSCCRSCRISWRLRASVSLLMRSCVCILRARSSISCSRYLLSVLRSWLADWSLALLCCWRVVIDWRVLFVMVSIESSTALNCLSTAFRMWVLLLRSRSSGCVSIVIHILRIVSFLVWSNCLRVFVSGSLVRRVETPA